MTPIKSGINIAAAAALLAMGAVSTPSFAQGAAKDVHCYGVNSCKGQGFKEMSAKACAAAGGSLTEAR